MKGEVKGPYANRVRYSDYGELDIGVRKLLDKEGVPVTTYIHFMNFAKQAAKAEATMEPGDRKLYLDALVERYARSPRFKREVLRRILAVVVGAEVNHKGTKSST